MYEVHVLMYMRKWYLPIIWYATQPVSPCSASAAPAAAEKTTLPTESRVFRCLLL